MGLPTFATLVNDKVLIPPTDGQHFGIDRYFLQECMAHLLENVRVDETWYLTAYPDVGKAIADGIVPDCKTHFARFGFYEHRMPYRIEIDEPWYLRAYPDIQKAVERKTFTSGQAHFDVFGYREGRLPFANFSLG